VTDFPASCPTATLLPVSGNAVRIIAMLAVALTLAGCQRQGDESDVVWATNVGGAAYTGVDGTHYEAETGIDGGVIGEIPRVKGSQDPFLYQTYRAGDVTVARPIGSGVYDLTLYFAEPDEVVGGSRVFDIIVEGERLARDVDVMAFRDGKVHSALTVTLPNIRIDDDRLDIEFDASAGEPILSAVVVRDKRRADRDWQLVWQEEFDYAGLPLAEDWNIEEWAPRRVNDENQAYTGRLKNVRVENGVLTIEAHKEAYADAEYTSGRIQTRGKHDFLYGRFEIRARLPAGQGSWPAIWMLPSHPFTYATTCAAGEDWQGNEDCDAWPNSGEIDIMEHVGYQMGHIHGTVHNKAYYWLQWEQRKGRVLLDDAAEAFHVYAMEWTPERIDVFVDDTHYFSYINEHSGWEAWPYDRPFHLIINVAVGGWWGRAGGPIDPAIFPLQMDVDYVRVYRQDSH